MTVGRTNWHRISSTLRIVVPFLLYIDGHSPILKLPPKVKELGDGPNLILVRAAGY